MPYFEPYACMVHNTSRFEQGMETFQVGLSDANGEVDFTYYPGYSELSVIRTMLKSHGFDVAIDQEPALAKSGVYNIHAAR